MYCADNGDVLLKLHFVFLYYDISWMTCLVKCPYYDRKSFFIGLAHDLNLV